MGYHKDREIQQDEQGWRFRGGTICYRCVSDPYLREMIRSSATESECGFCGRTCKTGPNSISFDDLMAVIAEAIFQYYDHAENEAIAWDSEEHEYSGTTYDTWDLVHDEIGEPSENEDVVAEIIKSLGDHIWCDKRPYSVTGADLYESSWDRFCRTVKHEIRYFFDTLEGPDVYSEFIAVPDMLDELSDIIKEAGLIQSLPSGTSLFRIRVHARGACCDDWRSLGAPPAEFAVSNRMSAAGISMFYAALDVATAKAETVANLGRKDRSVLTCGTWANTRPLTVLDLTKLPPPPSFYARIRYERDHLVFLRRFVHSISQPVAHDGREHIDYVPTQILTEYFRHRYRPDDGSHIDGIIYPSAQRSRGRSIVVFASHDDLNPSRYPWSDDQPPVLTLNPSSIRQVRPPKWKRTPRASPANEQRPPR